MPLPRVLPVPPQPSASTGPLPTTFVSNSLSIPIERVQISTIFPSASIQISIPQRGTLLWIFGQLRTDQAAGFTENALRFNGDAGNNYADQRMSASGAVQADQEDIGGANGFIRNFWAAGANAAAATYNLFQIWIPFFAEPNTNKQLMISWEIAGGTGTFGAGNMHSGENRAIWSPGAPINSVSITPVPGGVSYVGGSRVAAYVLL